MSISTIFSSLDEGAYSVFKGKEVIGNDGVDDLQAVEEQLCIALHLLIHVAICFLNHKIDDILNNWLQVGDFLNLLQS